MAEELIFLGFLAIGASSVGEVNLDLLEGWLATDWVISKSLGFGLKVTSGLRLITAVSSSSNTFGLGVLDDLLTPVSVSSIDRLSCSLSFVWAFCSCDFDRFFCGKKDGEKSSSPANSLLRLVAFRWDIGSKVFQSTWWGKIQRKHKKTIGSLNRHVYPSWSWGTLVQLSPSVCRSINMAAFWNIWTSFVSE